MFAPLKRKFLFFISLCIILVISIYIHLRRDYAVCEAEFHKLRPVAGKIYIYYNGVRLGHAKAAVPCLHSNGACVKLFFQRGAMFIPQNISVKMKQKRVNRNKFQDYLEIQYPKSPSPYEIQNGNFVAGETDAGFDNYMSEEIQYSDIEKIKIGTLNTVQNLEKITSVLYSLLSEFEGAVNKNNAIDNTLSNTVNASNNMKNLSQKLNNSFDENELRLIIENIENTTRSLNSVSYNALSITESIQPVDIKSAINKLDNITDDTYEILRGLNCTLRKPFGGLRILFGKTID